MILSGDTRQHGPVEVSDALRAIERYSGLLPAELNEIRRQDPARAASAMERESISRYREAVRAAADGETAEAFSILDSLGAVKECSAGEQSTQLADNYLALAVSGESALVVSQTRAEVRDVNEAIRARTPEPNPAMHTSIIGRELPPKMALKFSLYDLWMETLVCPHCGTHVPEHASVCVGCRAEIVVGATRRERSIAGCLVSVLTSAAFPWVEGSVKL